MTADLRRAILIALVMIGASLLAVFATPRTFLADQQPRVSLKQLIPESFGDWAVDRTILPVPPSPDLQKVIDATYDETLALTFRNSAGAHVMLSLAYGRNQHKGMLTHRPEVCYPAQGFRLTQGVEDGQIAFQGRPIAVKHLVAAAGPRNEPITYWVMVGDEITQFGYPHRFIAIRYGLQGVIPDGVLVRVSSISRDNAEGFALQARFVQDLLATLQPAQRARLLGKGWN